MSEILKCRSIMKSQLLSDFRFPVEFIMPTEDAFTIRSSPSFS